MTRATRSTSRPPTDEVAAAAILEHEADIPHTPLVHTPPTTPPGFPDGDKGSSNATPDTLATLQARISELERNGHRNTTVTNPTSQLIGNDDKRLLFSTYTTIPLDDITKATARQTWETYKKANPSGTTLDHFRCLVHYGSQVNMSYTDFCDLAATLYGPTTKFLYQTARKTFATPAAFYNACINVGDGVPPAEALRAKLGTLQHEHRTSTKHTLDEYIHGFFNIMHDLSQHNTGRIYKESSHATNIEFLRGFSRSFRLLIDEKIGNLDLGDTSELLTFVKQLWGLYPTRRMDYTGHTSTADKNRSEGPQHKARAHMLKRKADGPDPKWLSLQPADRDALKELHKRIKNPAHDLTTDEIKLLTRVKACHTCGSLNHPTTGCHKTQATATTA